MNQWLTVFYYQTFPILKIPFQKSPTTPPLTLITYPIVRIACICLIFETSTKFVHKLRELSRVEQILIFRL